MYASALPSPASARQNARCTNASAAAGVPREAGGTAPRAEREASAAALRPAAAGFHRREPQGRTAESPRAVIGDASAAATCGARPCDDAPRRGRNAARAAARASTSASSAVQRTKDVEDGLFLVQVQLGEPPQRIAAEGEARRSGWPSTRRWRRP